MERRKRTLTDEDIKAIVLATADLHDCSECDLDREELREAIKFYRNMNDCLTGARKTVVNTVLVFVVMAILGLISVGIWFKSLGG